MMYVALVDKNPGYRLGGPAWRRLALLLQDPMTMIKID
jgi:hypothetical protein